ncbi:MAG: histidinol-phosphate transaminase [Candidatus Acidiferrum sp.]
MKVRLPVRHAILNRHTYEAPAEGRLGKIRLDFNENTGGCSKAVIRALAKLTPQQIAMYPEYQVLSERLANYFGVRAREMLLTNGGDDALRIFFDVFVEQGSSILICEPTFPMYRYYAEISGARIDVVRYDENMRFPLAKVLAALRKMPRLLFLANPNNPTGTLLTLTEIRTILAAAPRTAVVIDEAYFDFSGMTAIPWVRKYPQLFVTRTFSKAAGLASLRLGAAIACEQSLNFLRAAIPPFPVNVPALVAAVAAVSDKKAIRAWVERVKRLRSWLASELSKIGVKTYPSAANFLLADFGPRGSQLVAALQKKGILVRDRGKDIGPGFVRVSIGTDAEMRALLREIKRFRKMPA